MAWTGKLEADQNSQYPNNFDCLRRGELGSRVFLFSQIYLLFFKKGLTNKMSKKIGILNLMHDKI
ncbi:hypothetical protein ACXO81_03200, partial [Lactobacillus delbrueckii subsp. bulgaricus]